MNRNSLPPDNSWESDAVWKLLDQAPPKAAGARFADDTVRAARLSVAVKPWWSRLFSPVPLAGLAAATAALAFTVVSWVGSSSPEPGIQISMQDSPQAAVIQEIAEAETLIAAVDHLEDFSDNELVSLIGF
jgi:hypothetical protein